jgi:hypothetical protein
MRAPLFLGDISSLAISRSRAVVDVDTIEAWGRTGSTPYCQLKIEFEGALLTMRVNGRALFGRRRWCRFVELAGYPDVELLSALAPDVCGDDNVVFFPSQGPCESPPPTPRTMKMRIPVSLSNRAPSLSYCINECSP